MATRCSSTPRRDAKSPRTCARILASSSPCRAAATPRPTRSSTARLESRKRGPTSTSTSSPSDFSAPTSIRSVSPARSDCSCASAWIESAASVRGCNPGLVRRCLHSPVNVVHSNGSQADMCGSGYMPCTLSTVNYGRHRENRIVAESRFRNPIGRRVARDAARASGCSRGSSDCRGSLASVGPHMHCRSPTD